MPGQSPSTSTDSPARIVTLSPDQGERFTIIGGGVRILIDGPASGGRCCMFEVPVPPGEGPPLHRHEREDEYFFVLKGRFKLVVDDKTVIAEPGAFACFPRGSIHAFRNIGSTPGLLHVTCTPAGLEDVFRLVRLPEPGSGRPPLPFEQVVEIFNRYGVTFHGPPLTDD